MSEKTTRRAFLGGSAAMLAAPALAQSTGGVNSTATTQVERDLTETVRRNISSFRTLDWQPYFSSCLGCVETGHYDGKHRHGSALLKPWHCGGKDQR